ncbi:MOG interacting and ectopic P-granules protein 1 isoform X2 [Toxorhynchites rutilus septentrionalis]|uniref:MOG interacting and ectopic P-granules protein 1 isoform X2 n=1 Tax=Toxorhynchites rutilus septentrionalis TaxID=329112 RepID=UPI0024788EE3|nr:MOG interacting and ectopic P-granules protein 1 isoform X2 [Toxorhynchites rutilus septentrionalis]
MGEVGTTTNEHPSSGEVKENGEINGNRESTDHVSRKTAVSIEDDASTKVTSESEVDENSQTSQPISSNGQTDAEADETSQDVEESRLEAVPTDSENQDTVESMEVNDEENIDGKAQRGSANDDRPTRLPLVGDSKSKDDDEPMDVDAPTNGHSTVDKRDDEIMDDDSDKPVSINSDSENEEDLPRPTKNVSQDKLDGNTKSNNNDAVSMSSKPNGDSAKRQNGDCDGDVTILSDKEEDCVVIDDEDGDTNGSSTPSLTRADVNEVSPRRSSRVRKSTLPQDISTIDDDDDIEEIIDDPLNIAAAKKPRLSINQSLQQNSFKSQLSMTPQPPQKSLLASNHNSATKEPTLVIIDTNTLMNRTSITPMASSPVTPKSLNSSYSALSAGMTPNSVYNSPRSVLNPVAAAAANLISKNNPPPLAPVTPLLPALTDDMFVLEAPSFIVPYIYEKPPPENLRDIVSELETKIKEMRKKLDADAGDDCKGDDENSLPSTAGSAGKKSSTPATEVESESEKKKKSKRKGDDDDEWDQLDTSTDDEASDEEQKTKILIKEVKSDIEMIKEHIITPAAKDDLTSTSSTSVGSAAQNDPKKSENYFENPLGKFFMNIGVNLVQEFVQTDLLRQQKKKRDREGKLSASTQMAINSLMKNLELSKENNKPYKFEMKRCEYCPFKSESALAMAHHYETPHMRNYIYKCNFCTYETRPPHDILYHMEAIHNIKGRLDKAAMYHSCPNCPFEDNGKSKLARHAIACAKKFRPEINLNPPLDWEPPAKIPRIKPKHGLVGTATAYQAMTAQQQKNLAIANQRIQAAANSINAININNLTAAAQAAALRARGGRAQPITPTAPTSVLRTAPGAAAMRTSMSPGMVMPNNFQLSAAQVAAAANKFLPNSMGMKTTVKPAQQPSISITPLPRQSTTSNMAVAGALSKLQAAGTSAVKPGQSPAGGKAAFVVCEICDGYIKDLDQLRNHMQWIHKVKIHPKMIYNRPPLNCQKCQYRFFTDQGLERHLLGSHGLVTSSMQEAANKGKDAGRCPVCGRVYQWKLLNHVSRDHNMTLKPAHLSYKCTVCTSTFGMYKQFESHVYSAHSTVAKKALDNKNKPQQAQQGGSSTTAPMRSSLAGGDSLLKPLKINDEITIIPQPSSNKGTSKPIEIESHVID